MAEPIKSCDRISLYPVASGLLKRRVLAQLVRGDALLKGDVQRVWSSAVAHGILIMLRPLSALTQCFCNAITTLPSPQTRIIVISLAGLARSSYAGLPMLLKPLYSWVSAPAHRDKIDVEGLIAHSAGWEWKVSEAGNMGTDILADDWKATPGLLSPGSVQEVLVVRPGLFTDGKCLADTSGGKKYRVSEDELGGWVVSRHHVAHFVVDAALTRWSEFWTACHHYVLGC